MGYIIKENQGLLVTRITDVGRRKISEGNFNISYFQIGDSEVNYNTLTDYNNSNFQILEPSYNAHNNVGVPQSNKNDVKYPFYLQGSTGATYGIPFMASSDDSIYNTAAPNGFFSRLPGLKSGSASFLTLIFSLACFLDLPLSSSAVPFSFFLGLALPAGLGTVGFVGFNAADNCAVVIGLIFPARTAAATFSLLLPMNSEACTILGL